MKISTRLLKAQLLGVLILLAAGLSASEKDSSDRVVNMRVTEPSVKQHSAKSRQLFSQIYPDAVSIEEEEKFFNEAQVLSPEDIQVKLADKELQQKSGGKSLTNTSHSGAFHFPRYVTPFGDIIFLEDNSQWTVRYSDQKKVLNWYQGDDLVITPNHDFFSNFDYKLTNITLKRPESARVNLMAPTEQSLLYNGFYTHWIVDIDKWNNKVLLEDGSLWSVSFWDSSELSRMAKDDTIIIGTNDSWFKSSRPNILINVNTMEYIKVNCDY